MKYVILFIGISFCINSSAQELPPLGKIDSSDLTLKGDNNTEALYLINQQETELEVSNGINRTITRVRIRIKIFNKAGFEYANVKLPVRNSRYRKVSDISGFVYTLDENKNINIRKLEKDEILQQKTGKKGSTIALAFPGVSDGCVIEYTYTYIDRRSLSVSPWMFQSDIPTKLAICKITFPTGLQLNHKIISQKKIEAIETFKNPKSNSPIKVRTYAITDVPAFKAEPFMSSLSDNLQRVEFRLRNGFFIMSSPNSEWGFFNARFYDLCESTGRLSLPGADSIITNANKLKTFPDKLNYIFSSLKKSVSWDETQTYYPDDVSGAWKTKSGSSAELNLILFSVLKKAGMRPSALLISTKENGKVDKSFVSVSQFNGLDVLVDDSSNTYVMDLTQKYTSFSVTPFNVLNTVGLLVDSLYGQWVTISDNRPLYKNNMTILSRIDSNGRVSGSAIIQFFDHAKQSLLLLDEEEKKAMEKSYKSFQDEANTLEIDSVKRVQESNDDLPLKDELKFKLRLTPVGNLYLLNPTFLAEFRNNPFTKTDRNFDIDFGSPHQMTINLHLTLNSDFVVDELPKNITLINPDSTVIFNRQSAIFGQAVQTLLKIEYLQTNFPRSEYPTIKEFFTRMYGMLNEPIILRKK